MILRVRPRVSIHPSDTGDIIVPLYPVSTTNPVVRPPLNSDKTASFAKKIAGISNFSNIIWHSLHFMLY